MSITDKIYRLEQNKIIQPPKWLIPNTVYMTIMGSYAYAVSDNTSDVDVYGISIPPKALIFPHTAGIIHGFGKQHQEFNCWQQHHIKDPDGVDKEYDFQIYNIVVFFQKLMENNPNILDSIFTPLRCVIHTSPIGEHIRMHRKEFLHKGAYHKLKGYAYSQLSKLKNKLIQEFVALAKEHNIDPYITYEELTVLASDPNNQAAKRMLGIMNRAGKEENINWSKRLDGIVRGGYDFKFAYHICRLVNQCEQILTEGDLDLERSKEQLKSIRRGEWTLERIEEYFQMKEKHLEELYNKSTVLPHSPNEDRIKELLLQALEQHYGRLDNIIAKPDMEQAFYNEIEALVEKYRR